MAHGYGFYTIPVLKIYNHGKKSKINRSAQRSYQN